MQLQEIFCNQDLPSLSSNAVDEGEAGPNYRSLGAFPTVGAPKGFDKGTIGTVRVLFG